MRAVSAKNPGDAILKTSEEENCDLIVIGCRGRGTLRRTILGTVSDYIVHHSIVPVIYKIKSIINSLICCSNGICDSSSSMPTSCSSSTYNHVNSIDTNAYLYHFDKGIFGSVYRGHRF